MKKGSDTFRIKKQNIQNLLEIIVLIKRKECKTDYIEKFPMKKVKN